jgi:hypothetical protein
MHLDVLTVPIFLLAIVIFSTLSFGAVEPWSIAMTGILTAVTFSIFAVSRQDFADGALLKDCVICGALVIAYGLFQLVPLPLRWLGTIHPALVEILSIPKAATNLLASGKDLAPPGAVPAFHAVSVYPFATEMELSRLGIYLMVFIMAAFGPRTHAQVYSVLRLLAVFGFILALFAVTQKATWNGRLYWIRELSLNRGNPFGPFVNRNHFAGWMCMVAPLSFGIGFISRSLGRRIRYIFFATVMATTIFFTLSRGGMISFFVGTVSLAVILWWTASSKTKLTPIAIFVLALFFSVIYIGASPVVQKFAQQGLSSSERLSVWSMSFAAFRDFPIFGTGLGTFQHVFPMYKPDGIEHFYQHAHNDYAELLFEQGIVGTVLSLLFMFVAVKVVLHNRWRGRTGQLKAAFAASLMSMAVFSFFDFNFHIPANGILFFFILGLAVALSRLEGEVARTKSVWSI